MASRDRCPKPTPQGPKYRKLPARDWDPPAQPAGMSRVLTHREIIPLRPDCLAEGPGFEPRLTESESAVLPLNHPPPAPRKKGPSAEPWPYFLTVSRFT